MGTSFFFFIKNQRLSEFGKLAKLECLYSLYIQSQSKFEMSETCDTFGWYE
jgi:hypothetical protein